jgi:hypothetical protein
VEITASKKTLTVAQVVKKLVNCKGTQSLVTVLITAVREVGLRQRGGQLRRYQSARRNNAEDLNRLLFDRNRTCKVSRNS